MTIRKWSLLVAAMLASGIAAAQTFPSKTVRLISGVTPGSASDTMARIVAEKLTASLGQSVIVENWLGAGGLVGASRVAKGDPDGHTIMVYASAFTVAPLLNPGVLDPKDAQRAVDAGVDGVVVSNHGGRQLDAVPSTCRALPDVVEAVGDRAEVLVDGGIRTGLDVVKMVALGARAVLIGRPWAWAVAAQGERGVRHVLEVMKADIDVALALTGHTAVADVDSSTLYQQTVHALPAEHA